MQMSPNRKRSTPVDSTAAEHSNPRINFVGLIAQAALVLSIAIAIAVTLAGAVLLLAGVTPA
jgi:hypothetical protein